MFINKKRYENYDQIIATKKPRDLLHWAKERRAKQKDLTLHISQHDAKEVEALYTNRDHPSITWIGHSTFLIQLNGVNIITDPVWAERMGVQRRLTKPGIALDQLPDIDVVLISHGHYDHLDFATLKHLKGKPAFFVPIGLRSSFKRRGYLHVTEANWWDEIHLGALTFTFVPAQHWTRRGVTDMNTSHWGGWVMGNRASDSRIYFVGDTGYFRGFKEIGNAFDVDTVLMPIGAYEPEWFMRAAHINPEDAIKSFLELKAKRFIPMHYGAYRLADDTGPEALERLYKQWDALNLSDEALSVLNLGESLWLK